jgi:NAD(P)-dependent dehydrogenase (short-subunit alcohol dehydrogenase family)
MEQPLPIPFMLASGPSRITRRYDAVVELIEEKGTGLYALVNNAGVGGRGQVIDTPIEDQTFIYNVNVEGVYRTTKAFAPLVIDSKGRIVTTGSIAGTLSAFPGFSAYAGSKHWIEAYTDTLATEMEPQGVTVSVARQLQVENPAHQCGSQARAAEPVALPENSGLVVVNLPAGR